MLRSVIGTPLVRVLFGDLVLSAFGVSYSWLLLALYAQATTAGDLTAVGELDKAIDL